MKKFLFTLVSLLAFLVGSTWANEVTDVLDQSVTGITTTSYAEFMDVTATSDAVYAGMCAGSNESIQLRSTKSTSGVVTTTSGGIAKKVVVTWNASTASGRVLDIYGSNTAYTAATDLYDEARMGTKIGSLSIEEATEGVSTLDVEGDYAYIGFRSASGAIYLTSVEITWETGSAVPTVAKPVITPYGGKFVGQTEAIITCETEGVTIYYSMNGEDPNPFNSPIYGRPLPITESLTLKAIAVKDTIISAVASATFTKIESYATLAELNALENNTQFTFTGEALVVAKPTAKYVYIYDNSGYSLIYDATGAKTADIEVGRFINPNWSGKVSIYRNMSELVPDEALTVNADPAQPVFYPEGTFSEETVHSVITLKNVTSYTVVGKNISVYCDNEEKELQEAYGVQCYNQFGLEFAAAEEGKTYEIVGAVGRYGDQLQFWPIEIKEDAEAPQPEPDPEFYVVGSMTEWKILEANKMTMEEIVENEQHIKQFTLDMTLAAGDQFKVVTSTDGVNPISWFPGDNTDNYIIDEDGVYTIYCRPNLDGGEEWYDNCLKVVKNDSLVGPSTPNTYYIKCIANGEGAITADKYEAAEGETVTLAATLAEGYMVDNMTIATEYGDSVRYKVNEAALTATFVMPAANVMIEISFKKIKDDEEPEYGLIRNADLSSTEGWTAANGESYSVSGNGMIGEFKVYGDVAATVDATHLATEYCFGFECRWSPNFASYTQETAELEPGTYTLQYDVENVNSSTTKATYENLFNVTVGDKVYTDEMTEWMNGKSAWTTHSISFEITEPSTATISLGYGVGSNNFGSSKTPILYVSHLSFVENEGNDPNPEPDTYYIKCVANGEGAITADKYEAAEGETVTLAATLAEGYMVDNMTIATEYGDSVAYKVNEAALTATFVMPAANVMIEISFKKIKDNPWVEPGESAGLVSGHTYLVRNVDGERFLTGAQVWYSWSTSAALVEDQESAIQFTLTYNEENQGWTFARNTDGKYTFISGSTPGHSSEREGWGELHVDMGSQGHNFFEIIKQDNGYHRIRAVASDEIYGSDMDDYEYKWWGTSLDEDYNGALAVYATVNPDDGFACDWEFIDLTSDLEREKLLALFEEIDIEGYDIDYSIYNDVLDSDDYDQIVAAYEELLKKVEAARTYAIFKYGEDGVNPPSEDNPCDATKLIKNNSFDEGNIDGWTCTFKSGVNANNAGYQGWSNYTNGDVTISGFIEAWANSSFNPNINFAAIGDGKLSQTMANLPQGKYRFTCDAIAVQQYESSANPVTGVELFATGGELEMTQNIATGNGQPEHFEVTFVSTGGDVEIGLRTNNATANWIAADNFTLTYYGETSEDPAKVILNHYIASLEEKYGNVDDIRANKEVKYVYSVAMDSAKVALEDYESVQFALREAAEALQNSIDEYAAFIADVEAFLEKVEGAAEEWPGLSSAVADLYQDARNSYYEGTATSESMANFANNSSQAIADYISENVVPGKDVSILLNNPGFAKDFSGWTVDKNGYTPTFGGENVVLSEDNPVYQYAKDGVVDGGCAEVWHRNFDIYQTIKNMPAGAYTLSCQAFEQDDNGNGVEAELYAFINGSEQTQKVIEINEDASNVQLYNGEAGGHGEAGSNNADRQNDYGLWIPNGMCGANVHFRAGYYNTNFDFILDEQGDITIGIRTKSNSDWVLFDDFKIVYKGKDANQLASTIDNLTEQIYAAQENEYGLVLTKDVQAEVEAAIAVGQEAKAGNDFDQSSAAVALLRQTLVDVQNNLQSLKAFYDEWMELCDYRFEGLDEDYYGISSLEIPYELVDEINEKLQNGDIAFENLAEMEMYRQEVKRQYTQAVMKTVDYSSANEDNPVNVSAAIYNPNNRSYENYWDDEYIGAKGWNIEGSVGYGNSDMRATEFYQQAFDINQTIYGLAPGWYRLKVNGFYRDGYADRIEDCLNGNDEEHKYATLYAGDAETPLLLITDKESRTRYSDIINDYGIEYIDESNSNRLYYINEYGDEEETYIPYNSRAANAAFNLQYDGWDEEPLWQNVLQFYVEEGQESVTIGIRKEYDYEEKSGDWTVFRNWQLEYVGTEEPANDPTTGGDYVEEPTAEELAYKRALESIEDGGIYRISANYNGSTYYLDGKGYLVDNASEAGIFNFSKINGSQYNWGFYVETEGRYFTNAPGTTAEYLSSGYICQTNRNRNEWDAQVFFLNEDGKYAVRSTNAKYAASSWSWIGSAYWTVEGDSIPVAQYSFDDNYIWELEKIEKHEVTSYLVWNGEVIDEYVSVQPLGSAPVVPQSFSDEMRGMYKLTANVDSITAETEEVYFTATWNGPFEFSESYEKAKWYHMDINNGYYVAMNESEPYYPTMDQDLEAEESLWAFLPVEGDPTGVKVINYAAGADMSLMRDGSYIVMRDGEFYWSVYSNSDGFSLCPQGSNYNWIYWSRYLRTYGSSSGNSDVRCKLRVTKADVNEFPENIMVKNEKTLNYAGKDVPEDYRPNITLAPTDMWIGDTGEPSTLGALTLKTDKVFSIGKLTMNFNPAQTNYYRYEWKNDEEIYIPHHTTMMAEGQVRADSIVTRMTLTDGQWNFITVPYDVRVGDIYCENQETDWVIRRYDGAARAELRLDETWVNVGADEILEAGKGYIMHCSYSPNWLYNSQVFYFPSLNTTNKNLIFSSDDRVIALEENLSEFAHNRSWNLIGNPFAAYVEFGSTGFDAPITVWDGQGNYLAYSPIDDEYYLSPGEAFFVQRPVGESAIIFDADARMSWYEAQNAAYNNGAFYAPARLRKASSNRSVLNLTLSDGEKSDRTRVVINPEAELAYETSCDAAKFMAMNANATQLFTVANGVQYAINERPLADGTVQLAARFGKAGTYTLRLQTASDMTVILVDKANGTMVELSSIDGYTFEALAGNADNRFSLIIGTADGIGTIAADELRDARIFTLDGKRLPSDKQPVAGVYLIQQKNGTVRKALLNK